MKQIRIADTTLCRENSSFSFKEKIEIARQLEKLNVDMIEIPEIINARTDILLIRTVSSFVKQGIVSVAVGMQPGSLENALAALAGTAHPCIRVEVPVSPVGMEYTCHMKAPKMLEWISHTIRAAKEKCAMVEFCAVDASRAEKEFLTDAVRTAVEAGATQIAVCDSAAEMLPDDFAAFAEEIAKVVSVPVGVRCDNKNGLACAASVMAVRHGVDFVKTDVDGAVTPLETLAGVIHTCGNTYDLCCGVRQTELHRIVNQIKRITDNAKNNAVMSASADIVQDMIHLDANDDQTAVTNAAIKLGYDLSEEDQAKVYEEFLRVADGKIVGAKELDAIVASAALQVPSTYKLDNYVINNGNIISASAQITLIKDDKKIPGISIGNGPVDAAFLAIEQIIGHHYELDDFQIQSVTEGKSAVGSAVVKLRSDGKLYSGRGISTDIIGASIRAYISAVNKIVYEEAQA